MKSDYDGNLPSF